MQVNEDTIRYLEKLTRLKLSRDEREKMKEDLTEILKLLHPGELTLFLEASAITGEDRELALRDDIMEESAKREEVLMNVPQCEDGSIIIPKVL